MNHQEPLNIKMFSSTIGGGGGVARYISNLTNALRGRGHHVTLIQPIHASMNTSLKVTIYNALGIRLARNERNCIIHSHEADGALLPRSQNSHLMTIHGVVADEVKYFRKRSQRSSIRITSILEGVNCKRADLCTAVSNFSRRKACQLYNLDESRVEVVHPCVDTETFKPARSHSNSRSFLFVGRIYKRKGLDTLLEALHLIRSEDFSLRVIGSGPEQNRIAELVRRLDLTGRVVFLGHVSGTELLDNYRKSDVLCVPSQQEGFSIVAIEAQACGLPVVGMRVGGLPEAVEDQKLLVEAGNTDKLSQVLLNTLTDASEARRIRCRQFVEANFAPEVIASKMEDVYRRMVEG